jgi:beta-lactam-binding protein with PASTA domain
MVTIPGLVGLSMRDCLERLGQLGINFTFTIREAPGDEKGETVTAQNPPEGTRVRPDSLLRITLSPPSDLAEGEVFGLFSHSIPGNPYPLPVRLDAILPSGERQRIVTVEYPGGDFTVPYRLPAGAVLILSMVNREIHRETVELSPS